MNCIDKAFFSLADEIRSLDEKELYYRMRKSFDAVPSRPGGADDLLFPVSLLGQAGYRPRRI